MKINILLKKYTLLALLAATTFSLDAHNGVRVSAKVLLSGPLDASGTMNDGIRAKGLLPGTEPYSNLVNSQHYGEDGGETVSSPTVFQVAGSDAIVDWVVLELRSANSLAIPVSTHAALLQRDGDIVSTDGTSPVHFLSVVPGQYHVSVQHRNHLGVMTAEAMDLSSLTTVVDFSDPGFPLYGTNPCTTIGGKRALWLGDVNRDKRIIHQGPGNDIFYLFLTVMSAPGNVNGNANYMVEGYLTADTNMDGYAVFNGPNNDRSNGFIQVVTYAQILNFILVEQIPD